MVTLLILDGFGIGKDYEGNAIIHNSENIDSLKNVFPNSTLIASGEEVGLCAGQMGNSETGHLNIGLGRVVYQDLSRINNDIKNDVLKNNETVVDAINFSKKHSSKVHLFGLLSDGGVHSHISHLKYLIKTFCESGCSVVLHIILDGRDTLFNSGISFVRDIENYIKNNKFDVEIADLVGRIYAMDREKRFDRVKLAYDLYVGNDNFSIKYTKNLFDALKDSYENEIYDEFVLPIKKMKTSVVNDNDVLFFYNFRTDRMREIVSVFGDKNFNQFETKKFKNIKIVTMTEYSKEFNFACVVERPEKYKNSLSEILAKNNLNQFRVTETTKYAHITFFFNGGVEKAYRGENRFLIDSINTKDFSKYPKMRAKEITEKACEAINSKKYDFILINLSNPDMIGHTGDLNATKKAIKFVDECVNKIAKRSLVANGDLIVTADHGNAEVMIDDFGNKVTSHTSNKVPIILVSDKYKNCKLKDGILADVAPTILKLLNIKQPKEMTGQNLLVEQLWEKKF